MYTIEHEPILSIDLMERASMSFVNAIKDILDKRHSIAIVCGRGNNGGDGLAVGRILREIGYDVDIYSCDLGHTRSPDNEINFNRLQNVIVIDKNVSFDQYGVIIDGLFGSGLQRPIKDFHAEVISAINKSDSFVISIDLPSGFFADKISTEGAVIKADLVISFQRPKLSFFFPESANYISSWKVADIGLNKDYLSSVESNYFVLDNKILKNLSKRSRFSHKGSYGHACIIAGSFGKMGASVLSSKACLRSGVGLVTSVIPNCGYEIFQSSVCEAMCLPFGNNHIDDLPVLEKYSAIGIGPGIGMNKETVYMIHKLLSSEIKHLIIDADGLNILSDNPELFNKLPPNTILTPHPKEFERMVGEWRDSLQRLELQIEFAKTYSCIVIVKDAHTSIATPEGKVYFNTSGNAGMATAGSGDVLTGILTGLVAQGYSALEASLIGVYTHGLAGDVSAVQRGQMGLIASDIIENLMIDKYQ